MIDFYVFFALGLATIVSLVNEFKSIVLKVSLLCLILLSGLYSSFVVAQYHNGAVHFDSMTKKSWQASFLKLKTNSEYWESLKSPDYEKAKLTGGE
jgi:hypothetical protein